MLGPIDRVILGTADPRYGIVTRKELMKVLPSGSAIDRRVRCGLLVPILPGVYRLSSGPTTWNADLFAATEWAGEGALVRGLSMAALVGLEGFPPGPIQLYTRTGKTHPKVETIRLRSDRWASLGLRWWEGIRTTTIERMLLDLCSITSPTRAGRAMDEALIRKLTALGRLRTEAEASIGCKGIRLFSQLLETRDDRDGMIRSEMERRMLRLLKRLPGRAEADHEVVIHGRRYFLDFAFPVARLAIECQSTRWHAGAEAIKSDSRRHRDLTLAGWTVLYYTWDDIKFRPQEIVREISDFLTPRLAIP